MDFFIFLDVTIFANLFFYSMGFLFYFCYQINMTNKGIKCITVLAIVLKFLWCFLIFSFLVWFKIKAIKSGW